MSVITSAGVEVKVYHRHFPYANCSPSINITVKRGKGNKAVTPGPSVEAGDEAHALSAQALEQVSPAAVVNSPAAGPPARYIPDLSPHFYFDLRLFILFILQGFKIVLKQNKIDPNRFYWRFAILNGVSAYVEKIVRGKQLHFKCTFSGTSDPDYTALYTTLVLSKIEWISIMELFNDREHLTCFCCRSTSLPIPTYRHFVRIEGPSDNYIIKALYNFMRCMSDRLAKTDVCICTKRLRFIAPYDAVNLFAGDRCPVDRSYQNNAQANHINDFSRSVLPPSVSGASSPFPDLEDSAVVELIASAEAVISHETTGQPLPGPSGLATGSVNPPLSVALVNGSVNPPLSAALVNGSANAQTYINGLDRSSSIASSADPPFLAIDESSASSYTQVDPMAALKDYVSIEESAALFEAAARGPLGESDDSTVSSLFEASLGNSSNQQGDKRSIEEEKKDDKKKENETADAKGKGKGPDTKRLRRF